MARKQNNVMAGVLTAAGAVSAMFGIRALVGWYLRRKNEQRYAFNDYTQSMMVEEIPVTGNLDVGAQGAQDMTGMMDRTDMRNVSDMQSMQSMQGMPGSSGTSGMPDMTGRPGMSPMPDDPDTRHNMAEPGMPEAGITATGRSEPGENAPGAYQSQQDQENAIPNTGMPGMPEAPAADMPTTREREHDRGPDTEQMPGPREELDSESRFAAPVSDTDAAHTDAAHTNAVNPNTLQRVSREPGMVPPPRNETSPAGAAQIDQSIPVGSLVGPLVVHLLSFHNMINMLRQHRETSANVRPSANTPDVRAGGADAVSSLEGQVPEFDRSTMAHGSLQARMIQMMDRIRDALQNMDYSEDQLMQIDKDLRSEVCKVLEQIHQVHQDDVTGFEDVQKAYHC